MITPMQMYWLLKLDDIIVISLVILVLTFFRFCALPCWSYNL